MNVYRFLNHVVVRNLIGFLALLLVHVLADVYAIDRRPGLTKVTPYLYLTLLYGWLIFHNRVLFENLFLRGRRGAYWGWFLVLMLFSSFNMNFILHTQFGITWSLPYILSFWVYTVTGLGVYITYKYLCSLGQLPSPEPAIAPVSSPDEPASFACMVDGDRLVIPYTAIQYIESLENYLKIFTKSKVYVTRMTLKEAEARLPKRLFIRISRSHIINSTFAERVNQDMLKIDGKELRIGKVYKRHVSEHFAG